MMIIISSSSNISERRESSQSIADINVTKLQETESLQKTEMIWINKEQQDTESLQNIADISKREKNTQQRLNKKTESLRNVVEFYVNVEIRDWNLYISTNQASNSNQVCYFLNNWCIWMNLSGGWNTHVCTYVWVIYIYIYRERDR